MDQSLDSGPQPSARFATETELQLFPAGMVSDLERAYGLD